MEFLRVVEEELRGLAAEARRRHPVVQEAAERAILKLRNMREEYAVALRQQHEGNAPPLSMFRSQDLLRPFLLACNHADASPHLMIMAMESIQYLINRDAILPSDAPNILRVLAIQSQSKDADVQKRVLQTMMMVVPWKSCDMTEDTVSQALGVCLGLHDAKNATVRTAADMTVRQIISLLFNRVADELGVTASNKGSHPARTAASAAVAGESEFGSGMRIVDEGGVSEEEGGGGGAAGEGALRCAHLVFQDLCVLSRGEQGQWIKRTSVSATLGLELVEQVLSQQPILFRRFKALRQLLSQEVCPLIQHTLRRRMNFPLLVRVLRAASTLVVTFGDLLPIEIRAVLSTTLSSLGTGLGSSDFSIGGGREGNVTIGFSPADNGGDGGRVSWAAALTLEAVHRVLSNPPVVLELFRHGEGEGESKGKKGSVVEELLHAVSQYLLRNLSTQNDIQGLEGMAQSIRLGRVGSPLTSGSPGEGKRLPLPPCLTNALARDEGRRTRRSTSGARNSGGGGGKSSGGGGGGRGGSGGGGGAASNRSSSLELMHETEQPTLDDAELLLWALQCVVDVATALSSLVHDGFQISDPRLVLPSSVGLTHGKSPPDSGRRQTLRNMCEALWGPVLSSLSLVMGRCSDPLVVSAAVDGYTAFAVAAGILGVTDAVDGFIGSLCRFSLPQWHGTDVVVGGGGGGGGGAGVGAGGGGGQGGGSVALTWNHVGILESLLQVAHRLGNLLRGSWHVVLDTLEQAADLLGRRAIARPRWSPQSPDVELAAVEKHCKEVLLAAERLVLFSTCLEDEALYALMSSLQALAVVDLANTATVLPQERATAREREAAQLQANQNGASGEGRGAGAAAVAAASGLVSFVGAAARGVGAAMSEGREAMTRDNRTSSSGKMTRGTGDSKAYVPWVSSRLVVQCAVANTWRLPVVWELVSGHLRVVAKAREPGKREYAVRALRELIVDGVKRLHPLPAALASAAADNNGNSNADFDFEGVSGTGGTSASASSAPAPPPSPPGSGTGADAGAPTAGTTAAGGTAPVRTTVVAPSSAPSSSRGSVAPPRTSGGGGSGNSGGGGGGSGGNGGGSEQEEGFLPTFLGLRARLEGAVGGEDEPFRWLFDCDVGGVFLAAARRTTVDGGGGGGGGGGAFEGVLFKTMGLFALTPHVDTREATLQTLYSILQSCGQVLESAWPVILNLLHSVAKGATDAALPSSPRAPVSPFQDGEVEVGLSGDGSDSDSDGRGGNTVAEEDDEGVFGAMGGEMEMRPVVWGGACLSLAFKCLQLVVDEFLERLPREQVPKLVVCAGAFGGQTESVNLSLTAIGMLWTVCDTFADATAASPGGSPRSGRQEEGRSRSSHHPPPTSSVAAKARPSLHSMWPTMLFQLRSLAVDFRPELRNCAVNTLFSAAVGNGDSLTESEWKQFLLDVTFPLIEQVLKRTNSASRGANTAVAPELKKGVRMLMHHTRDTDQKQWNETRVLAMQGLGRVLRAYVTVLARWNWFSREGGVWAKSLEVYRDACLLGSDSQEVSLSGVDGITTMVLLVGRTGLKSVQVRAGTGMKIVDGTLQRSPPSRPAATGKFGREVAPALGGGGGGGSAGTARDWDGEAATAVTPEFAAVRPGLYATAWAALVEASRFEVDANGDVAPVFVQGLAAVYKAGVEDGAELSAGQEGEEKRMEQLFEMLDGLFAPRVPAAGSRASGGQDVAAAARRPVYLPKVTPGQRAILDFLQEDIRSGWRLAVRLLAKYSVVGEEEERTGGGGGNGNGNGACPSYAARGVVLGGATAGPGGVSVECVKEAATALSAIMSKETVPKRDRALALEGLLSEVSGPCVRRLEGLRRAQRQRQQQQQQGLPSERASGSTAGLPPPPPPPPPPVAAAAGPSETDGSGSIFAPVSGWPSIDSYSEVMRLLLALLNDGFPSLADSAAFQDRPEQQRDDRLVSCFRVAIAGVAAVTECRGLKMGFLKAQAVSMTPGTGGGRGGAGGKMAAGGSWEAFPQLLREVLSFITGAVRSELAPMVQRGSGGARNVVRSLIDTFGAIALSAGDAPASSYSDSSSSGSSSGSAAAFSPAVDDGDGLAENSAPAEAFGLAVNELARMCGEQGERNAIQGASASAQGTRSWALLGLPLRRRACWHLLRCIWSTTRRFRSMEDDLDRHGQDATAAARSPVETGHLKASLAPTADRCTCAMAAAGKVRLPPALLTPRFKKLVATKQAQETGLLKTTSAPAAAASVTAASVAATPPSPSAANGSVEGGGDVELAAPEDAEWATMAEEDEGEGSRGNDVDVKNAKGSKLAAGGRGGGRVSDDADDAADDDEEEDEYEEQERASSSGAEAGREHLVLLCRALLACSASRTERVRESAALLLADADVPGALDALQDEVASLKRALRQRKAQLSRKNNEVGYLRAQVAAGSFM